MAPSTSGSSGPAPLPWQGPPPGAAWQQQLNSIFDGATLQPLIHAMLPFATLEQAARQAEDDVQGLHRVHLLCQLLRRLLQVSFTCNVVIPSASDVIF